MATFMNLTLALYGRKVKFNPHAVRSVTHRRERAPSTTHTHRSALYKETDTGSKLGEFLAYAAPVKFNVKFKVNVPRYRYLGLCIYT